MKLCVTARFFGKTFFAPKIGEMGQKYDFLNLNKNLAINFHWIFSIMKTYTIYCVPAPIAYFGKILFLRYGPKCSKPIRLQDIYINYFFRTNWWNSLIFACWYKFIKIKSWLKFFWLGMVKNGCDQPGLWTLKLTVSEEWIDVINWFFACWYKFFQIKRWLSILGGGNCQKWVLPVWSRDSKIDCISKMNRWNKLIFACWYKFRKFKRWFNDFWVGVVKNDHGL